jgi:hypothetical protein
MLKFLYIDVNKRLNMETIFKPRLKYNYTRDKMCKCLTPTVFSVKAYYLKENYKIYGSIRSFSSGYVKLRANNFGYLKDLRSELQTISDESSVDSARRITRAPNPNRILCLVKRIFTIYGESDLDAKINQMNDLLSEDI